MGGMFNWLKTIANSLNLNLGFGQEKKGKLWDGRGWAPSEDAEEEDSEDYDVDQWEEQELEESVSGSDLCCDFSGMDLGTDGLNGDDESFGCLDGGDWDSGDCGWDGGDGE